MQMLLLKAVCVDYLRHLEISLDVESSFACCQLDLCLFSIEDNMGVSVCLLILYVYLYRI